MADNNEQIGMVFPYLLGPREIPRRDIEEAVWAHGEVFRLFVILGQEWVSGRHKAGEEFATGYRTKEGKEFVVVTQPDGLASFVMTRAVYEKEYRPNPLRLTAESLELIKEVPELLSRKLQEMKLDRDHTLLH